MLPPIDDSILEANPRFAALHNTLAKHILNANGSTKIHPAQKERDAVSEALKTSRLHSAKSQFLKSALQNLDLSPPSSSNPVSKSSRNSQAQPSKPQAQPLPSDLIELILLLTSHLTSRPLSPQNLALLQNSPPWTSLPTSIPKISGLLSTNLHSSLLSLCRILNPSTNASYLHLKIPLLLSSITTLQSSNDQKRTSLQTRRVELTTNTTTLLTLHHLATHLLISHLEQTTHGLVARHVKARAEYLGLRAVQLCKETEMKRGKGERVVYTEEVRGALENYVRELRGGRERGRERRKEAERVLWGYGVGRTGEDGEGKEKVMREVARVYGELVREVREVGRDVERLRGR